MSLLDINQQITIYVGSSIVIIGVVGNGINILVFSSARNYRRTPCTFYFLIASIYNISFLTINLIARIVSVGSGFDLTRTSNSWCKIRQFCLFTLSLITLTCSCLATIDQYFATSQSANLRRFSNIKFAHRTAIIVNIIWYLQAIPDLYFFNISPITAMCVNTNSIFAIYVPISFSVQLSAIPIVVMVLFGYLTYRNIQLTRVLAEQHADRQLVRMTLIQVVLMVICFVPFGIINLYSVITSGVSKDLNRLMIEGLTGTIISLLAYFYYAGNCYMFLISSSRFRRTIKDRIFFYLRPNRVVPFQQDTGVTATLNVRTRI